MAFFKLYLLSLAIFLTIDLFWLGVVARNLYRDQIGTLMVEQVRWLPALFVYCLYVGGLVFFALMPAVRSESWSLALLYGGLFGLVCYGTYDLTNLATLKGWPLKIAVYDLLWGVFVSAITCAIVFWINLLKRV